MCSFFFFLLEVEVHRCTSAYLYRFEQKMKEMTREGHATLHSACVHADRRKDGALLKVALRAVTSAVDFTNTKIIK